MSTDLVKDTRARLESRIKELRPAVDELHELERILAVLEDGKKKPRRRVVSGKGKTRGRKPARASEFLTLVEKRPGITVSEAAKEMGMDKPNYLYRIARELKAEKKVAKKGSGYQVKVDKAKTNGSPATEKQPEVEAVA